MANRNLLVQALGEKVRKGEYFDKAYDGRIQARFYVIEGKRNVFILADTRVIPVYAKRYRMPDDELKLMADWGKLRESAMERI